MPYEPPECKNHVIETEANMAKDSKTFLVGRNAETGRLTTVQEARAHPKDHVVERMPKPGRGDTK